jgi:uncharacterized protein (DUF433 family)
VFQIRLWRYIFRPNLNGRSTMSAYVVRDGETGEAVISGTRISVVTILRELAASSGAAAVLDAHPGLTPDGLAAAISFAAAAVERDVPYETGGAAGRAMMVRERSIFGEYSAGNAAVVLGSEEYDDLVDQVGFLRELCTAHVEVAAGETVSQDEALAFLRSHFGG